MCTKSVHERRRDELTTQKSRALVGARGELALQTHHVADDLGHRLEMLGRNRIVDLDRGVQRAGQGRVLHTGTSFSSATARIRKANASTPLATQTGAAILPLSYLSATAKWVGFMITTVACGTAAIMRFLERS